MVVWPFMQFLADKGFLKKKELDNTSKLNSILGGHPGVL